MWGFLKEYGDIKLLGLQRWAGPQLVPLCTISATCATRKFAADVRFNPQAADCGIAPCVLRNIAVDPTSAVRNVEHRERENILSFSVCQWTVSHVHILPLMLFA